MIRCLHQLGPPNAMKAVCPKCGATIGMACQTLRQKQAYPHKARRHAYEKLMSESTERKPS